MWNLDGTRTMVTAQLSYSGSPPGSVLGITSDRAVVVLCIQVELGSHKAAV